MSPGALAVGDPGDGKTWMMTAVGAAVTRGWGLPDAKTNGVPSGRCDPSCVLYLTAEDGLADTIRPRLDTMGADCARYFALTAVRAGDAETPVTLQAVDVLDDALTQTRPGLVVVDPLQAFLGDRLDMHRANETRPVLAALGRLAEKHGCAVVCICHLNKATQSRALYRVLGSIDFAAAVRSVLLVGRDSDDQTRRAVIQIKNNLAPEGPALAFSIDNDRFEWCGLSQLTAAALLASDTSDGQRNALGEANDFLTELLNAGPLPAEEVYKQARAAGIAQQTLERAKANMRVKSQKTATGWAWTLPEASSAPRTPNTEAGDLGGVDLDEGVIP